MIDSTLKPLYFRDRNLYYNLRLVSTDYGCGYITDFYLTNNITKSRKKYYLWGPTIKIFANEVIFTLRLNIESCNNSKKLVSKKLDEKIDLLDRCEEIKNGNIV